MPSLQVNVEVAYIQVVQSRRMDQCRFLYPWEAIIFKVIAVSVFCPGFWTGEPTYHKKTRQGLLLYIYMETDLVWFVFLPYA